MWSVISWIRSNLQQEQGTKKQWEKHGATKNIQKDGLKHHKDEESIPFVIVFSSPRRVEWLSSYSSIALLHSSYSFLSYVQATAPCLSVSVSDQGSIHDSSPVESAAVEDHWHPRQRQSQRHSQGKGGLMVVVLVELVPAWITVVKSYDSSWATKVTAWLLSRYQNILRPGTVPKGISNCVPARGAPKSPTMEDRSSQKHSIRESVEFWEKVCRGYKIMLYTERNHMKQYEPIWTVWHWVIVAKLLTSWLCEGIWRDYHGCDRVRDKPVNDWNLQKSQVSLFRL